MAQPPTAFSLLPAHGTPRAVPVRSGRIAGSRAGANAVPMLARVGRMLRDVVHLARAEDGAAPEPASGEAELIEARLSADRWQREAELAQQRVRVLEAELAGVGVTVLELRSRIICLQGKLAATSATARYQTLAMELVGQGVADQGAEPRN